MRARASSCRQPCDGCPLALPSLPQVLAELLLGLDSAAGTNPNTLHAARRHALAGSVLSKPALEAVQRHRAACMSRASEGQPLQGDRERSVSGRLRRLLRSGSMSRQSSGALAASGAGADVLPADVGEASRHMRAPSAAELTDTLLGGFGAAFSVRCVRFRGAQPSFGVPLAVPAAAAAPRRCATTRCPHPPLPHRCGAESWPPAPTACSRLERRVTCWGSTTSAAAGGTRWRWVLAGLCCKRCSVGALQAGVVCVRR